MVDGLLRHIAARGARGAVVPFARIADLKQDMQLLKDGEFHTSWLDRMANHIAQEENKFLPDSVNFVPRSLISIAIPSPKLILPFTYRGKVVLCTVPPHYQVTASAIDDGEPERYIQEYLVPLGYHAAMTVTLSQKILAVHCGLARYGRNNIAYHEEFGSHMLLMSYVSDMPCVEDNWLPLRRMERCDSCRICVESCPTGALNGNRNLVDADRCITAYNENLGDFPDWLDNQWHNSLTGCMACQEKCPANAHNAGNAVTREPFIEEETREILHHKSDTPYTKTVAEKLAATGISQDFLAVFPRNLALLLAREAF